MTPDPLRADDEGEDAGPAAIALAGGVFDAALAQLAAAGRARGPSAMTACAAEIRRQATGGWRLEIDDEPRAFFVAGSQRRISFGAGAMGPVLGRALALVLGWDDAALRKALSGAAADDRPEVIMLELVKLFVAHELLHVRQQLGSSQYLDSDHYGAPVVPIDYQADVASIWYVSRFTDRPAGMSARDHLVLLVAIHVAMMLAFSGPLDRGGEIDRATFNRLLVWHFQFMRFAGSEAEPDLDHASVQAMPVFAFPRVDGAIGAMVSVGRVETIANDRPDVLADIVVALAAADGVLGLLRFPSTDRSRVSQVVGGVLAGDIAGVREALEELRIFHAAALDFDRQDTARLAADRLLALAEALLNGSMVLDPADPQVLSFLEQAEYLVLRNRPRLAGEGLDDLRDWWSGGVDRWLEDELRQAREEGVAIDAALRTHVRRIASRIGLAV